MMVKGLRLSALLAVGVGVTLNVGCQSFRSRTPNAADRVAAIQGKLLDISGRGDLFYGSVVYLIPDSRASRAWWDRLGTRPTFWLSDPYLEQRLDYTSRTVCDSAGHFTFTNVKPGDYFLHARVFWTNIVRGGSLIDGGAYVATATVTPAETLHVTLKPPRLAFEGDIRGGAPRDSGPVPGRPSRPSDDSIPAIGGYAHATEPAVILTQVAPVIPKDFDEVARDRAVVVCVLVGKDGRVKDMRLMTSVPLLNAAALEAAKQYVFRPAYRGRIPVESWVQVDVPFRRS